MTRHLCISVTFLDPLFHGQGDEAPEWPPSPMRLFQALLAGARAGCRDRAWCEARAEAFRWLERRSPPEIVAPEADLASAYTLFVPNNDSDEKFERQERLTSKVVHPHRFSEAGALHYLWSIADEEWADARPHAELLGAEARGLLALGWGVDQVVGDGCVLTYPEVGRLPGRRWRVWDGRQAQHCKWRAPVEGSLQDLERVHASFLQRVNGKKYRPPLKPTRFQRIAYGPATMPPARAFAAFECSEGVAFRQEDAAKVAAMLRSLVCRPENRADFHAQFPGEDPEVYLAGHVRDCENTPPRFSYLPLPTIGHEHTDGMLRRFLIVEPCGGDGSRARWAEWRLRNQLLRDAEGNERGQFAAPWRPASRKMIERYVGAGQSWSTVTPVILPGFDDGKRAKASRLFLQASSQAGVPVEAIADFTLRKAPFWPGSQHPRQYFVPAYLGRFPRWHVHVQFVDPIGGPLAIGAGRHCGLGLFARDGVAHGNTNEER